MIEDGKESMSIAEIIFEIAQSDEGGYEAPALGHNILTQCEDWNDLKEMVRDAVLCHVDGCDGPRVIRLHRLREEPMAV